MSSSLPSLLTQSVHFSNDQEEGHFDGLTGIGPLSWDLAVGGKQGTAIFSRIHEAFCFFNHRGMEKNCCPEFPNKIR